MIPEYYIHYRPGKLLPLRQYRFYHHRKYKGCREQYSNYLFVAVEFERAVFNIISITSNKGKYYTEVVRISHPNLSSKSILYLLDLLSTLKQIQRSDGR